MFWIFSNSVGASVVNDGVYDERLVGRIESSDLRRSNKNGNGCYGLAKQSSGQVFWNYWGRRKSAYIQFVGALVGKWCIILIDSSQIYGISYEKSL
jgi:hypothetical protein